MAHYLALIHKDEGSAWGISFPDFPGCFSAADEEADIIANAMEALELYLEDDARDLPTPASSEKLRSDPEIAAALAQGAYLMAIPFFFNSGRTERINITLNKGLLKMIDEEASRRKMTRSAFIAQSAEREMLG
ncbi:MAG: type II toxin-antitoxin system HicB family antitoxin [Ahrensia sp.]|nr:type II toxin-antitoxin system HicB family antitoxin [Ahrensia sp.]